MGGGRSAPALRARGVQGRGGSAPRTGLRSPAARCAPRFARLAATPGSARRGVRGAMGGGRSAPALRARGVQGRAGSAPRTGLRSPAARCAPRLRRGLRQHLGSARRGVRRRNGRWTQCSGLACAGSARAGAGLPRARGSARLRLAARRAFGAACGNTGERSARGPVAQWEADAVLRPCVRGECKGGGGSAPRTGLRSPAARCAPRLRRGLRQHRGALGAGSGGAMGGGASETCSGLRRGFRRCGRGSRLGSARCGRSRRGGGSRPDRSGRAPPRSGAPRPPGRRESGE